MSLVAGEALTADVATILRNAPEWLRHDLGGREPSARLRDGSGRYRVPISSAAGRSGAWLVQPSSSSKGAMLEQRVRRRAPECSPVLSSCKGC